MKVELQRIFDELMAEADGQATADRKHIQNLLTPLSVDELEAVGQACNDLQGAVEWILLARLEASQ